MLPSSIAVSKARTTVLSWKSKPGPATSARAPKACALKALDTYPKVLAKKIGLKTVSVYQKWRSLCIRKRRMDQLGQDMRQNSSSPDTEVNMQRNLRTTKQLKNNKKSSI